MTNRPPLPYDFLPTIPSFRLDSPEVPAQGTLPDAQVSTGGNISPALSWSGFPAETQSFAVSCFDPDAPTGSGFWHWMVFDIPATVTSLPQGAGNGTFPGMPAEAIHVRNDAGSLDFTGAAPPPGDGSHRYVFAVHALDVSTLGPDRSAAPAYIGFNLRFHAIARALLIAEYELPASG